MNKVRTITHYLAVGAGVVWAFMLSPAGQAVQKQYPHVAATVAGITTVMALYFQPQASGTSVNTK
jgi:hypothetical protein